MGCRESYHYYGQFYRSKAELIRAYNLTPSKVYRWIRKGHSFLDAVDLSRATKIAGTYLGRRITVQGKAYRSLGEVAEDYGISYETLKSGAWGSSVSCDERVVYLSKVMLQKRFSARKRRPGINCQDCGVLFSPVAKRYRHEGYAKRKYCPVCTPISEPDPKKPVIDGDYCGVGFCRECDCAHEISKSDSMVLSGKPNTAHLCGVCREILADESRRKAKRNQTNWKHTQRAVLYGCGPSDKGITAEKLAKRDNYTCQECGCAVVPHPGGYLANGWTVGHIIPMSAGGPHTWDNTQCECHECNTRKGATHAA
jgi:5-methylcytosine-specific restriction endonuclease McrA